MGDHWEQLQSSILGTDRFDAFFVGLAIGTGRSVGVGSASAWFWRCVFHMFVAVLRNACFALLELEESVTREGLEGEEWGRCQQEMDLLQEKSDGLQPT